MRSFGYPQRVICLTEETTETMYALGAEDLIVGISGFTVRPPRARKEKPKVSTYLDARFDDIIALQPDVVFAWSDLQADISAELIRRGINVVCFNQRSVEGILAMIVRLGGLIGRWLNNMQHSYAIVWMKPLNVVRADNTHRASTSKNGTTHSLLASVG